MLILLSTDWCFVKELLVVDDVRYYSLFVAFISHITAFAMFIIF